MLKMSNDVVPFTGDSMKINLALINTHVAMHTAFQEGAEFPPNGITRLQSMKFQTHDDPVGSHGQSGRREWPDRALPLITAPA